MSPQDQDLLGQWYLFQKDYDTGLPLWEARLIGSRFPPGIQWQGELGKSVIVFQEAGSGIGDCICFARYLDLMEETCERVAVSSSHQSFLDILPKKYHLGSHDSFGWTHWCAIKSLPHIFKTRWDTVPPPLATPHNPNPVAGRIGVRWSGNPTHENEINRRIDSRLIASILSGYDLHSLHENGETTDGVKGHVMKNMCETAELIATMSLVITADTSVAHLSATLGVPTWILLPSRQTFWLWGLEGETTPWYPSARLFRQSEEETWKPVLERVRAALDK